MSAWREGMVDVPVGHGLLIQQSGCQVMASTDLISPVNVTDVQSCWRLVCLTLGLDACAPVLWCRDEPTALLWVAPYPGEASAASTDTRWHGRTGRVKKGLMTGVLCTRPGSVGLNHHYVAGNQHMSRSRKTFFSALCFFSL